MFSLQMYESTHGSVHGPLEMIVYSRLLIPEMVRYLSLHTIQTLADRPQSSLILDLHSSGRPRDI